MKIFKTKSNKGFSIIEVIIVCAVISISVFSLMSSASKSIQVSNQSLRQAQATLLMEEGVEAVKSIRDNNWSNISSLNLDTDYYLSFNSSWSLNQTSSVIDNLFTRKIRVSSVSRNNDDDIDSSGTVDDGTRKVTVTVSWNKPGGVVNKNISFYITDIFN